MAVLESQFEDVSVALDVPEVQGLVVALKALVVKEPVVLLAVFVVCWTPVLNLFLYLDSCYGHSVRGMLVDFGSLRRLRPGWHRWCR